jgi:predicted RecB family nuclease
MRLTASDLVSNHRPSFCDRRVLLRHRGEPETPPSPFDQVLRLLGQQHERNHVDLFGEFTDIGTFSRNDRIAATLNAIAICVPVIYQPLFLVQHRLSGIDVEIEGVPDLIVRDGNGYVIRDVKIARRIDEENHPEILLQVQLYGWLYERVCGKPPTALQVWGGTNEITGVPYDGGTAALAGLERLVSLMQLEEEPYEPVGWSKCGGCGFSEKCWPRAEESKDVSLVLGIDQGLARRLHETGVCSRSDLLVRFDATTLSELKRSYGGREQQVGKVAERILQRAAAMETNSERVLVAPVLPASGNLVMFDLEGMPPRFDELEKVYLWGAQVFGQQPTEFFSSVSGFGTDGDREGWFGFLRNAGNIFAAYGDLPFVHWASYEKTKIDLYLARYGDVDGNAARVKANLVDLLTVTRDSMVLPLPSLSLKVVEEYVGFKRSQTEYGGDWAMAMFIEATETKDEGKRRELVAAIEKYNQEDLAATWAVFKWLRSKTL